LIYDRAEDMAATTKRHPSRVRHRTAVSRDGKLLGAEIEIALDGGAYSTLSATVLSRATIHAGGSYYWPNIRVRSKAFRDELSALRSVPRIRCAAEFVCDRAAHGSHCRGAGDCTGRAAASRNFLKPGPDDYDGPGKVEEDIDLDHLMGRALAESEYHAKRERLYAREQQSAGMKKKGIGLCGVPARIGIHRARGSGI
jgi:xanthine dehydrogenase molybdopterin-binding subunit B